jgi:hypothetical protein
VRFADSVQAVVDQHLQQQQGGDDGGGDDKGGDDGGGDDGGGDASLAADGFGFDAGDGFVDGPPGDGRARWVAVGEYAFLDAARSPALSRAFFVPGWSRERNTYGAVVVYERVADGEGEPFEEEGDVSSEVDAASGRARGGDEVEEL